MQRYIAFVWDALNRAQVETAERMKARARQTLVEWRIGLDQAGIFVTIAPRAAKDIDQIYPLTRGQGIVIGRLFDRAYVDSGSNTFGRPNPVKFNENKSDQIIATGGEALGEVFWGSYVAFLTNEARRTHWVLRDPTGQIACHAFVAAGVTIYFVNLNDLRRLEIPPLRIDRDNLIGSFVAPN
jgi:hypothetical protein